MDELKKQAEDLGIKVDGRWSAERLQAEIDEKLAEDAPEAPVVVDEPVMDTAPVEPEPEPEFDAEAKAAADAEIEAEIQARYDASQQDGSVVIINLQANPMKVLGLASYGEATLTAAKMADPRFAAKVQRAIDLGLIMVKNKAE